MIAAPPPAAPPVVQPIQRYFKDWLLVCDNGRRCTVRSAPADHDALTGLTVTVVRDAGPAAQPNLTLISSNAMEPDQTVVDDTGLPTRFRLTKDGDLVLSGDAAVGYLRRIRNGRLLRAAHTDDGPIASLDGLSAALLAMDDAQGRLETTTALVRTGPKPPSAVPPAPPLPVLRAAPPAPRLEDPGAFAAAVRRAKAVDLKTHDCQSGPNLPDDQADPLNAEEVIVTLGCGSGAGGQGWSLAYRAPRKSPARAVLLRLPPAPSLKSREETPSMAGLYTAGDYVAKIATFIATVGWHASDCGSYTSWVFDGREFHLSEHDELTRCQANGEPGEWPTVWRTRVIREK